MLKFQHLSTLLIDSNCLLLVLKMFGLQELLTLIQSKHEKEDHKYVPHSRLRVMLASDQRLSWAAASSDIATCNSIRAARTTMTTLNPVNDPQRLRRRSTARKSSY